MGINQASDPTLATRVTKEATSAATPNIQSSAPYWYDGFVSYRHDVRQSVIAKALQRALHRFARPWNKRRAVRLYRDETNLSAHPDLWGAIQTALDQSRFLLLMASPEAAASPWVDREVSYWLDTKGPNTLLIVVTGGAVVWDKNNHAFDPSATTALPPSAVNRVQSLPFWVDLAWAETSTGLTVENQKFRDVVASLAATLHGKSKDDLYGEDLVQQRRTMRLAVTAIVAIAILAAASIVTAIGFFNKQSEAVKERNRAEDALQQTQRALLEAGAQESILLTRDNQPERAWSRLREGILKIQPKPTADRLPNTVHGAALMALIENRNGPKLSLNLGEASRKQNSETMGEETSNKQAAFNADGTLVAAARFHELGLWRVSDGDRKLAVTLDHPIDRVFFHKSGNFLFAIGTVTTDSPVTPGERAKVSESSFVTAIDTRSYQMRVHSVSFCRAAIPCIAARPTATARLIDIRGLEHPEVLTSSAAALPPNMQFIVPTERHHGVAQKRFHVIVTQSSDAKRDPAGVVIFDETNQTLAKHTIEDGQTHRFDAAAAADAPIVLVGSALSPDLNVFRIDTGAPRAVPSIRSIRKLKARLSAGTENLGLDAEGRTLFYSNRRWGTGGGNGEQLTAAVDIQTERQLWSNDFEGRVVFSADGSLRAHAGGLGRVITRIVSGETAERIFDVEGTAVTFDPSASTLLVELWSPADATVAEWRLAEVIPVPSLSREERMPRATTALCGDEPSQLRIMADRQTRRWNQYDWRRVTDVTAVSQGALAREPHATVRRMKLQWKEENAVVFDITSGYQNPPVLMSGTLLEVESRFPELRSLPRPSTDDILISTKLSADRRWVSAAASYGNGNREERFVAWQVTEAATGRVVRSGKMKEHDPKTSELNNHGDITPFFLDSISAVAVQHDECSLILFSLPDGAQIGQLPLAFQNVEEVQHIGSDIFAVVSRAWSEVTRSVQIVRFPSLQTGPWLLFGSWNEDPSAKRLLEARSQNMLYPYPCPGKLWFTNNGQYLMMQPDETCSGDSLGKTEAVVLEVPPWGRRLEQLLLE